jgi:pimeloyl-ACP methyl ester carboxylesterase
MHRDALKFFDMNRKYPLAGRVLDRLMAFGSRHDHERFMKSTVSSLPPVDRAAMVTPTVGEAYVAAVGEAFRQGPRGLQVDAALISGAWDLELQSIGTEVLLWHGEHDTNAPPAMGHWLTQALPNCTSQFVPGEVHISLIVNWAESIFRETSA